MIPLTIINKISTLEHWTYLRQLNALWGTIPRPNIPCHWAGHMPLPYSRFLRVCAKCVRRWWGKCCTRFINQERGIIWCLRNIKKWWCFPNANNFFGAQAWESMWIYFYQRQFIKKSDFGMCWSSRSGRSTPTLCLKMAYTLQCEAPKIAKLVYNSNKFMVLITIVTGAYKPTYNWGASHCKHGHFKKGTLWDEALDFRCWWSPLVGLQSPLYNYRNIYRPSTYSTSINHGILPNLGALGGPEKSSQPSIPSSSRARSARHWRCHHSPRGHRRARTAPEATHLANGDENRPRAY